MVTSPDFPAHESIDDFADFGVRAFTTTRAAGSFGMQTDEPVRDVMGRWHQLRDALAALGARFASGTQVHGDHLAVHEGEWQGWLRVSHVDGHVAPRRGTAMAVTVADCVPIFIAHPSGAAAILHSGWRGTASGILDRGIDRLREQGLAPRDLRVHLGPAICGDCYEVSPDVYAQLTGRSVDGSATVDLREVIAARARSFGIEPTISPLCTRCDADRFFSHRGGSDGRQLGVIVAIPD
ncbi:MAG: polyphenol oxidase family protein [Gemmatimonadota bacterium]|nr:polyphenol oxidase family protein [Gemmatimonadota bacterium]